MARAACLVPGPSYDEVVATDFPWLVVRMRRPDGTIAVYRHYAGDPRGTPKRRDFEDELLRALGLRRWGSVGRGRVACDLPRLDTCGR